MKKILSITLATAIGLSSIGLARENDKNNNTPRLYGENRYETTARTSQHAFKDGSKIAIVASGETFPDALAGSGLANVFNAPVLVNGINDLNPNVKAELIRLGAEKVYVLGGPNTISESVIDEIDEIVDDVERIDGDNRYETAAEIAEEAIEEGYIKSIAIATGESYADALSAGSYVTENDGILLLTDGNKFDEKTMEILNENDDLEVMIFGPSNKVSDKIVDQLSAKRIGGSNDYETSLNIANYVTGKKLSNVVLASGENFSDALSALSLLTNSNAVVILVPQNMITQNLASQLGSVTIVGGPNTVSPLVQKQVDFDDDDWKDFSSNYSQKIDSNKALDLAYYHAGVNPSSVRIEEIELDYDDGRLIYEIEFKSGGIEYEYDIDAATGAILDFEKDSDDGYDKSKGQSQARTISKDQALNIAYKHSGISSSSVRDLEVELDDDDGRLIYEIEFEAGGYEYEFHIDAATGAILDFEKDSDDDNDKSKGQSQARTISRDQALNIAYKHSGISSSSVRDLEVELDDDDGRLIYEIEFEAGGYEYEFHIDGISGSVLDYEKEYDD